MCEIFYLTAFKRYVFMFYITVTEAYCNKYYTGMGKVITIVTIIIHAVIII